MSKRKISKSKNSRIEKAKLPEDSRIEKASDDQEKRSCKKAFTDAYFLLNKQQIHNM